MNESAFRSMRGTITRHPCTFEKALLVQCAGCSLAVRHALAEREAIGCRSPVACANCSTLSGMLRERSAFALRIGPKDGPPPHSMSMRLQCGGMAALAQAVDARDMNDVHAIVTAAQAKYGSLSDLPWSGIVAAIASWQGRPRRDRHR